MKMVSTRLSLAALGLVSSLAQAQPVFFEDFNIGLDGQFSTYTSSSDKNWFNDTFSGTSTAAMNGYGGNEGSDDWLISPIIDLSTTGINTATLSFTSRVRFDGTNLSVKVSSDFQTGSDPATATWTELNPSLPQDGQGSGGSGFESSGDIDLAAYLGQQITIAFHYQTSADADGDNGAWYIDDVLVDVTGDNLALPMVAAMTASKTELKLAADTEFKATAYSGVAPYTYTWDFDDGSSATGEAVTHQFNQGGDYTVTVVIEDANAQTLTLTKDVYVEAPNPYVVKAKTSAEHLRVATFNVSMEAENYTSTDIELNGAQILADELAAGDNQQIKNIAQIIQLVRPDVVLLNEFDYIADENSGVDMFISQYLNIPQSDNAQSIDYPYYYVAPSNTGIDSGFDLNNDGNFATADDAYGYGRFEGQYGMLLLSRYPIAQDKVRTFQKFLWKDMPNNLMPVDPANDNQAWYNQDETNFLRLSSKSHWDVPVEINGELVHILASHPTPPVFDGDEDRNGRRNHDEIRLWADYINGAEYIYDDQGETGGLYKNTRFVIAGDLNASVEGDAYPGTIDQLLLNDKVYAEFAPASNGGVANDSDNPLAPYHTASWQMRADYVLTSRSGLNVQQGSVFWPTEDQDLYPLVETRAASSDHRLVWVDVAMTDLVDEHEDDNDDDDDYEIDGGATNNLFWLLLLTLAAFRRLKQ
ncbi:endonuclease/exonuclease/phosphatase family protein [Catenovulum sp. SX2]|uniref:endonuclease/exonuclease/phosphatase family protein n=1 Tax=Catenovulum sp. SX2 TaxID=3398614 RepID=UPI003F8558AF